jgi:hypothetical protein
LKPQSENIEQNNPLLLKITAEELAGNEKSSKSSKITKRPEDNKGLVNL